MIDSQLRQQLAALPRSVRAQDLSRFVAGPGHRDGGRPAAVLMLFGVGAGGEADVLLTQRSESLRAHPGQVSFPGGAVDPTDAGPADAAVREATEETGLDPTGVDVIGELPAQYLPARKDSTGYLVTPVLAWWRQSSQVAVVDPAEVARVVRVSLSVLTDPDNRCTTRHPSGLHGPAFTVDGLFVWGFTAALLAHVLALLGMERPWPTARVRPLPQGYLVAGQSIFSTRPTED